MSVSLRSEEQTRIRPALLERQAAFLQDRLGLAYALAGLLWFVTRILVLVHQGAWPWMNSFVVDTAESMLGGNWDDAVRPPLPSLLAAPFLAAGWGEETVVTTLYVVMSLAQFGAFALVVRQVFARRPGEQVLALLLFLVLPINHSIHHWRNTPTVMASTAVLLLAAHWLWTRRGTDHAPWRPLSIVWAGGAIFLGVWSRTEMLTFVGVLAALGLLLERRRAVGAVALYALLAVLVFGGHQVLIRASGADTSEVSRYHIHTFLDSMPYSWLSRECQLYPSENCRDAEGDVLFGPIDRDGGLTKVLLAHPVLALAKTARSGFDNFWIMFGANPSTYPGVLWLVLGLTVVWAPARAALRRVPRAAWPAVGATLAMTIFPPLAWAPAHPSYHLHTILAAIVVAVPVLASLWPMDRGRLAVLGFLAAQTLLSAIRYTRYPGY